MRLTRLKNTNSDVGQDPLYDPVIKNKQTQTHAAEQVESRHHHTMRDTTSMIIVFAVLMLNCKVGKTRKTEEPYCFLIISIPTL